MSVEAFASVVGPPAEESARRTLDARQRRVLLTGAGALFVALVVRPQLTLLVLVSIATAVYVTTLGYRMFLLRAAMRTRTLLRIDDAHARAVPDTSLPVYTVLVPMYREAEVVATLVRSLGEIEYPTDRLDIKLLLEADDHETIAALDAIEVGPALSVALVPPGEPRTKPKALDVGLSSARGELVTIFDAEDRPDPLQLRRAAIAFSRSADDVACFQARLSYHNATQNLITRWFALEYTMWFSFFLPGLVGRRAPLPLGGTSNHFRRGALESLGAWDPYNVTEDADVGMRLSRAGYRTGVLDSVTMEEANSDFVNWAKQRSRWYKGYLQTWLVHNRRPLRTRRELGTSGYVQFNLFVGGTPLLAIVNPVFWALTMLWFVDHPPFVRELFPAPVYLIAIACWAFGNFAIVYATVLAVRTSREPRLLGAALCSPIYWLMMSVAAIKALVQLITAPTFWEKTTHGLEHRPRRAA